MKGLREKLHSRRGASILMALLLFFVCCMVAASVLAAAVSNAGKDKSGKVEQQKYLTLSSVLRLVCGELEKLEYTGKYEVYLWDVTTPEVKDSDGNITQSAHTDYYFYCRQVKGELTIEKLSGLTTLQTALLGELDKLFGGQFTGAGYSALSPAGLGTPVTLTVALEDVPTDFPAVGSGAYEIPREVTVTVKVNAANNLIVTAKLGTGEAMTAELGIKVPTLDYNPGAREPAEPVGVSEPPESKAVVKAFELIQLRKGAS